MNGFKKAVVLVVFAAGTVLRAGAAGETVYLDLEKVFSNFYKTKLADTQLKAQVTEVQEEGQGLVDAFKELQETFERLRTDSLDRTLSEELRENKRNEAEEKLIELQQKEAEIRRYEELSRNQLENQKQRMRVRLLQEIREAVTAEARLKGYAAVINSTARGATYPDVIIYFNEKSDITEDILSLLNRGQTVGTEETESGEAAQ